MDRIYIECYLCKQGDNAAATIQQIFLRSLLSVLVLQIYCFISSTSSQQSSLNTSCPSPTGMQWRMVHCMCFNHSAGWTPGERCCSALPKTHNHWYNYNDDNEMYLEHVSRSLSVFLLFHPPPSPISIWEGSHGHRCYLRQEREICCVLAPCVSLWSLAVPGRTGRRRLAVRADGFACFVCRQLRRLTWQVLLSLRSSVSSWAEASSGPLWAALGRGVLVAVPSSQISPNWEPDDFLSACSTSPTRQNFPKYNIQYVKRNF